MRLKRKYKIILIILISIISIGLIMKALESYGRYLNNWYTECDSYYGHQTDYYTCRNYHIGNK